MSSSNDISRRQALRRVGVLLGGVVSAPTVAGILSGCERGAGAEWSPQVLSTEQNEMVATIAEIIIPATDTPGAREANVNRFVDAMVGESYPSNDRDRFLSGLDEVNARSQREYGAPFVDCTAEQQQSLVQTMDTDTFGSDAPEPDLENPRFFRMMKELTVVGYYTSEVGATQELRTNVVPGYYDGDVPYDQVGRAWSGAAT